MTKSQNRADEPIMGRADVLFRFLQLIGKDRPADIDVYLNQLDVKNEDRPITDQLVDLIISGDKQLYGMYEQARREIGSRNPYGPIEEQSEQEAYERAIGFFLSKWIAFEVAIRSIAKERLGNDKAPFFSLLRTLQLFSGNDIQAVEYIRQLRNDLVHGVKTPKEEYIVEAGQLIERLLNSLSDHLPDNTRIIIDMMLQRSNVS